MCHVLHLPAATLESADTLEFIIWCYRQSFSFSLNGSNNLHWLLNSASIVPLSPIISIDKNMIILI